MTSFNTGWINFPSVDISWMMLMRVRTRNSTWTAGVENWHNIHRAIVGPKKKVSWPSLQNIKKQGFKSLFQVLFASLPHYKAPLVVFDLFFYGFFMRGQESNPGRCDRIPALNHLTTWHPDSLRSIFWQLFWAKFCHKFCSASKGSSPQ